MPHESDLYVGRDLEGRWRVGQLIGEGGFSVVMQGKDLTSGAPVAVKILRISAGAEAEEELAGEIGYLTDLRGCNRVVDIKGHGRDVVVLSGLSPAGSSVDVPVAVPYLVLERADGCLAELLVALDQVSWSERLNLFRDVVKGVHQMHLKRIVSRDLKSENVLLFTEDFTSIAKITDLGRARRTSDAPRRNSEDYLAGRGDFRFAPPEVFWRQGVDDDAHWQAVDLFHLGSVLYELVLGHGITSVVLPNGRSILQATAALDPATRKAEYAANIAVLRAQMALAWEPFASAVPRAVRPQTTALLRQLTDPDPMLRLPRSLGQTVGQGNGLEWLLRRSDIVRRTLANAESEASRVARRKDLRRGAA
jgi:serine/threonine protein kinase